MSHFLQEFDALLEENKAGSATRVFEIAGLDKATLSHIRNRGRKIQFADLAPLAAAIGHGDLIYLRLLRARLLDECTDPRAARIAIEITGAVEALREENRSLANFANLPNRFKKALQNIADNVTKDAGLRSTVLWLGEDLFGAQASSSNSPVDQAAADIVGAAVDDVLSGRATRKHKPQSGPVTYKVPRRSSKRPPAEGDAT